MKGIVFSELVEMVEDVFSPEIADKIIEESDLPSGGAYTSVGTYDHEEVLTLVTKLSEETNTPIPDLVKAFGGHLFSRFVSLYPDFFAGIESSFDFLETIEEHVHVEVRKLYPDAELPTFRTATPSDGVMTMEYESKRPFADLARGLIEGCVEYYQENVSVSEEDLSDGQRKHVKFTLTRG